MAHFSLVIHYLPRNFFTLLLRFFASTRFFTDARVGFVLRLFFGGFSARSSIDSKRT